MRGSKKGMEFSGLTIIMTAVILIAIVLIAFYWIYSSGKSVKAITGCQGYTCSVDGNCPEGQIISLTSCTNSTLKRDGRCCTVI